ncbi:hypothetical protein [Roseovarius rhodophyticola]|uniref:Uncharacterized protein n=1 Tax=Roseovarius rhodophyticola TaxID=3080827 RepID=A0ABZ2TD27_9RHOB
MIRRLFKWAVRLVLLLVVLVIGLLLPAGYNELACIPKTKDATYTAILPPEHHRSEARTLMTYPEWHIVHAYDDYAQVISTGDPHDFGYLQAIGGFWSSLCELSFASADHGGMDWDTKRMVYVIGVSFTAELLAKAAYEETLGRAAAWQRGEARAPLDELSADQARAYAAFLQQVPWFKWDFDSDREDLLTNATDQFRDVERAAALGTEYKIKAAYARVIGNAVEQVGPDELSLRMIVSGLEREQIEALDGVTFIDTRAEGIEIETPRYRELTELLVQMAGQGAEFVEIAGNDDIMFTALSQAETTDGALHSFARQGYGDTRHLVLLKVSDLAERLRQMQVASGPDRLRLEHIHDY